MIVKIFNNGWGDNWPVTQLEQKIVRHKLKELSYDNLRTVVINSTWYTQDYHQQVLCELRTIEFDRIVLIAMLDPAIPQPDWYNEFNCNVYGLGYYSGPGHVDFWALVLDKFYQPVVDDLLDTTQISLTYMCLNRKPHWHRLTLYKQLENLALLDRGIVTLGGTPPVRTLSNDVAYQDLTPNAGPEQYGIVNDIVSLGNIDYWKQCFLNIVTETAWNIPSTNFVSEKIYKPIVGCKPFLVYDPGGAVDWLTSRGFEHYTRDFTDISDLDLTDPNNVAPFINTLSKQSLVYYQKKIVDLKDKIVYNKNQFSNYVSTIKKGIACQI